MTINKIFPFHLKCVQRLGKPKYKITSLNNLHPPDYIFSYSGTLCLGIRVFCIIIPKIISQNFVKMYPNVKLYFLPGTTPTYFPSYFLNKMVSNLNCKIFKFTGINDPSPFSTLTLIINISLYSYQVYPCEIIMDP